MIRRASLNELGIVLTYIHLERSGGQVASSVSRCTVRALHSTAAVPTVGGILGVFRPQIESRTMVPRRLSGRVWRLLCPVGPPWPRERWGRPCWAGK